MNRVEPAVSGNDLAEARLKGGSALPKRIHEFQGGVMG